MIRMYIEKRPSADPWAGGIVSGIVNAHVREYIIYGFASFFNRKPKDVSRYTIYQIPQIRNIKLSYTCKKMNQSFRNDGKMCKSVFADNMTAGLN